MKKGKQARKMPYNNSEKQTDKEFYTTFARLLNVTPATVKRYWVEGFYEAFVRELYLKGGCRLPLMGNFSLKHISESYQEQKNIDGKQVVYRVPERDVPYYIPSDNVINDCNMMGVTKAYRKRAKAGKLTQRDYQRQIRAERLGVYGSLSKERIEKSKEDFKETLEKVKQEKEDEANGKA